MSTVKRWYAPIASIKNDVACHEAIDIASWIADGGEPYPELDENALFKAMHSCAYRSTRNDQDEYVMQEELDEWARRWQVIREYIYEQNLGLVYTMLARVHSSILDRDELLSEGLMSLMRAVDRFNPTKGYRFSTYACNVIGRALRRLSKRENKYQERLQAYYMDFPDASEKRPDTRTELYVERLQRVLDKNLAGLTPLETEILTQRFPEGNERRSTFRTIGANVGLSKERVRQIQKEALSKIEGVLHEDPVLQYC